MYKIPNLIIFLKLFKMARLKNPKDIAEYLNQYFVNVAENIDKENPRTRKCLVLLHETLLSSVVSAWSPYLPYPYLPA